MKRVGLIGLCKIELPGSYGAVLLWRRRVHRLQRRDLQVEGRCFRDDRQHRGDARGCRQRSSGAGNDPSAAGDSTPGDLSQPGFQTSRVRFWIGEYDVDTGELDGTPDVIFDGQLDRTMLTVWRLTRTGGVGRLARGTVVRTQYRELAQFGVA